MSNRSNHLISRVPLIGLFVALIALPATAGSRPALGNSPLPDFNVRALDSTPVRSGNIAMRGKWLLIYVNAGSPQSMGLLKRLLQKDFPGVAVRTVIISAGFPSQQTQMLRKSLPDLSSAAWYADPARSSAAAMKYRALPLVLGMQDNTIKWALSGNPSDIRQLQSALIPWAFQGTRDNAQQSKGKSGAK